MGCRKVRKNLDSTHDDTHRYETHPKVGLTLGANNEAGRHSGFSPFALPIALYDSLNIGLQSQRHINKKTRMTFSQSCY